MALANVIYQGGLYAVATGHRAGFGAAVARAFVQGGVSLATATQAFMYAGFEAGSGGITLQEVGPGAAAIVLTYAAYAAAGLG